MIRSRGRDRLATVGDGKHEKTPPRRGFGGIKSLTNFRRIAEGDCEEEGGNREGKDEDVSEAFHRVVPRGRSVEGSSSGGNVALGQATGGLVAQFLEQAEFHLIAEVGINTSEHVAVQGAGTVPDVAEEEQQREGGMAKGEPAAWGSYGTYCQSCRSHGRSRRLHLRLRP